MLRRDGHPYQLVSFVLPVSNGLAWLAKLVIAIAPKGMHYRCSSGDKKEEQKGNIGG